MKRELFYLACAGSILLMTGCRETVMNPRQYKPCQEVNPPQVAPQNAPVVKDDSKEIAQKPAPKTAINAYKPMTGVSSSGGVEGNFNVKRQSGKTVGGIYVVQPGDTCGKIAYKNHVKLSALLKANNLTDATAKRIRAGQKLVIPGGKTVNTVKNSAKKGKNAGKTKISDGYYTVQPGDFPQKIAKKLHVKLSELMSVNGLDSSKASRLQVGQKLIIPGRETVGNKANDAVKPVVDSSLVNPQLSDAGSTQVQTPVEQPVPAVNATPEATIPAENNSDLMSITDSESIACPKDCTAEEFAKEHNVPLEKLLQLNPDLSSGTDNIPKDHYVFVPRAEK